VIGVHSQHGEDQLFEADHFVLASGSFFSRGLESRLGGIREPIFDADVLSLAERDAWAGRRLFDHHPSWASGSRPTSGCGCCAAADPSPTFTAPAACWRTMTIKEGSGSGVPLPPAGKPLAIFWRRAEMNHIPTQRHGVLAHDDAQSKGLWLRCRCRHRLAGRRSHFEFSPMMISPHIPCLHTQREEN
jgi:hypothetical protein